MDKKKQKNNIEDNDDIIEMGPVNEKSKIKNFNIITLSVGVLSLIFVISLFLWINFYKIPKLFEESLIDDKQKFLDFVNNEENKLTNMINKIDNLIKVYENKTENFDNFIKTYEEKDINLNLTELKNKIEEVKFDTEALRKKVILIESSKKEKTNQNNTQIDGSDINRFNDDLAKKKLLLDEFNKIKTELFNKKSYGSIETKKEQDIKDTVLNYLSGFFNLRDYRKNENPRSLLARAEKKANDGDLDGVIKILEKLPDEWKKKLETFIEKYKEYEVE